MSTTTLLPLLILSPNALLRDCLVAGLSADPGFAVQSAGGALPEALQAVLCHRPEVVVVDSSLAGCCELIEGLAHLGSRIRVVVVGLPEDDEALLSCIERGAAASVRRGAGLAELRRTLKGLIEGEAAGSPPRPVLRLPERFAESAVTAREAQILELIAEGLSNKEIAKRLYLSLATVKNHVHNILDKLGVSGRYAAVAFLRGRRPKGLLGVVEGADQVAGEAVVEPRFGRRRGDAPLV